MDFERETKQAVPPIEVPSENLSPEVLEAIIESFILREGTDYGVEEVPLQKKKDQIRKQLERKDIKVVFDFNTESVTLLTQTEWAQRQRLNKSPG